MAKRRSQGTEMDNVVTDRNLIAAGRAESTTTGMGGGDRRAIAMCAVSRRDRNPVNIIPGDSGVPR